LAAGCGNDDGGGTSSPGKLIFTQISGIVEFDIESREMTPLITSDAPNTFLLDPAVSPDGARLAYILQPPPTIEGNTYDAGSDLWVANRDGSGARLAFEHAVPNQLVRFPRWQDNEHILAVVQEIMTAEGVTRVVYTLQRINIETGDRSTLLEDVLSYDVSPDGREIVYARYAGDAGQTLDLAAADGGDSTEILGQDAALTPFQSPRFSPDGSTVAFASADLTGVYAPVELVRAEFASAAEVRRGDVARRPARCCEAWPTSLWSKIMNGVPQDIWTVGSEGGEQPIRVADLKEDLPSLAWGGNGEHIYVLGLYGLYDVNLTNGVIDRIGEGTFHGHVVWVAD
jgi:dipeptidyl aminopeptidase/acylaminoacyl peptidase